MLLTRQQRHVLIVALIASVALAGAALAVRGGWLDESLQTATYDRLVSLAETPPRNQVTVVGIDDKTVARYGVWPIHRGVYVDALRALAPMGTSVIGFDVGFFDASPDPAQDLALARAISEAGNVILAMQGTGTFFLDQEAMAWRYDELTLPIPALREAAAGLASVNVKPDDDARVRRALLAVTDGSERYWGLPLVLSAWHIRGELAGAAQTERELSFPSAFGTRRVAAEHGADMRIFYTAAPATPLVSQTGAPCAIIAEMCVVSMADVIDGLVPESLLRNRIVIVGAHSLSGVPDDYPTPNSGSAKMWGAEIWANATQTILTGRYPLLRQDEPTTIFWFGLFLLGGFALIYRFALFGFLAAFALLLGYALVATILFAMAISGPGTVEAPSLAYAFMAIPWWVVLLGYLLVEEQLTVRRTQSAFGLAVTPQVAKHILALQDTGDLQLGGEMRQGTVMFGDIRGFTTISEGMSPALLLETLNRYFDGMVQIVNRYEGLVNKYNGDNIMVIWNAPISVEAHPRKAVECALELQRFIVAERARGGADVSFGFGINSGDLVAGFLGAHGRLEYTVIGDTVNVASRLTSNDIARRDQVAVSVETLRLLGDDVTAVELGRVVVKGRAEPVHCFQIDRLGALASPNPAPPPEVPIGVAAVAGLH